jgi:hypothetical protein
MIVIFPLKRQSPAAPDRGTFFVINYAAFAWASVCCGIGTTFDEGETTKRYATLI